MKRFLIDKNYGAYLSAMGFSLEEVLKKALLPEDLFTRQTPSLTVEEYFRFSALSIRFRPMTKRPSNWQLLTILKRFLRRSSQPTAAVTRLPA